MPLLFKGRMVLSKGFGYPAEITKGSLRYHIRTTFAPKSLFSDILRSCSPRKLLCGKPLTTKILSLSKTSNCTPFSLSRNRCPAGTYGLTSRRTRARIVSTWWVCFYLIPPNRLPLPQLVGVANGLAYLHSREIVHGDLKGVRVIFDLV